MDFRSLVEHVLREYSSALRCVISELTFEPAIFVKGNLLHKFEWNTETVDTFSLIQFWAAVMIALRCRCESKSHSNVGKCAEITAGHIRAETCFLRAFKELEVNRFLQLSWIRLYERSIIQLMCLLDSKHVRLCPEMLSFWWTPSKMPSERSEVDSQKTS